MPKSGRAKQNELRRRVSGRRYVPDPGAAIVVNFDSELTLCGCSDHAWQGVRCTQVSWRVVRSRDDGVRRYRLRCLLCGKRWRRTVPRAAHGSGLNLDAGHPEERERTAARRAARLVAMREVGVVAISAGGMASSNVEQTRRPLAREGMVIRLPPDCDHRGPRRHGVVIRGPWRRPTTWRTTALEWSTAALVLLVLAGLFVSILGALP